LRAIQLTFEPTPPAAPETSTVSPFFAWPMSTSPKYDVKPVIPSTPIAVDCGDRRCRILYTT
jgi:hypothetical protein